MLIRVLLSTRLAPPPALVLVALAHVVARGSWVDEAVDRIVYVGRDHLRALYDARRGVILRPQSAKRAVISSEPARLVSPYSVAIRFIVWME